MNFWSTKFVILDQKFVKIWEESVLENSINFVNFWRNWWFFFYQKIEKKKNPGVFQASHLKKTPPKKD